MPRVPIPNLRGKKASSTNRGPLGWLASCAAEVPDLDIPERYEQKRHRADSGCF